MTPKQTIVALALFSFVAVAGAQDQKPVLPKGDETDVVCHRHRPISND